MEGDDFEAERLDRGTSLRVASSDEHAVIHPECICGIAFRVRDLDDLVRRESGDLRDVARREQLGLQEPWQAAPALVDLGYDLRDLQAMALEFSPMQLVAVIEWLVCTYTIYSLLDEVHHGAGRISELVKALKSYSYMDQAPVQSVDIHEGLDNTLVVLRSKLKPGITVHRQYAPNLPKIQAYGSELNQVWTNLIDNAIDAMQGEGEITLRTRQDGPWVVVEVIDNGPGIPQTIQGKLFDPFFTTKPPGKGTGLGLSITHSIVVETHHGRIDIRSQPGQTIFEVSLPLELAPDDP